METAPSLNPFAAALNDHLLGTGESEAGFGRRIGVGSTQVNRWRREGQKPRLDEKVAAALRAMGKTVDELYPATPDAPPADESRRPVTAE